MSRDSMIFYRSFYEAIRHLDPLIKAEIYDAIFEYSLDFKEPDITGLSKTLFTLIKPQLDANNKRFENGRKGGRPSKTEPKNNQTETKSKPNSNQEETKSKANNNNNVNNNVNNNANCNVNANDILLEKETKDIYIENGNSEIQSDLKTEETFQKKVPPKKRFSIPTVEEVSEFCLERNNTIDPQYFIDHYESNGWMVGKTKMKDWKATVRKWERNSIPNKTIQHGKQEQRLVGRQSAETIEENSRHIQRSADHYRDVLLKESD